MDTTQSLYCKVYVDMDDAEASLIDLVSHILAAKSKRRTISTAQAEIDVIANDEFDPSKRSREDDQFLFYRFYLDIFPTEEASRQKYIQLLSKLLSGLWRSGC